MGFLVEAVAIRIAEDAASLRALSTQAKRAQEFETLAYIINFIGKEGFPTTWPSRLELREDMLAPGLGSIALSQSWQERVEQEIKLVAKGWPFARSIALTKL